MAASLDQAVARTPTVGDKAPDLVLATGKDPSTGKAVIFRLSEAVKEGPVVVAFFPGAFTSTCTKELCAFSDAWDAWAGLGARFIGVSVDSVPALRAYAAKHAIKLLLGSDFERVAIRRWNVVWDSWWGPVAKRSTFVVDRTGTIRYARVESSQDDEPPYDDIKAVVSSLASA